MLKHLKTLIAPVLAAVLAAGVANGAFFQWSKTAASNGNVDASINWQEGMAPSSINDSARAMMARLAEWRDDNSGILGTSGTSSAYTVSTNQGLPSTPVDGTTLVLSFHATNVATPTLQADGGGGFPIQQVAGTPVGAGVIQASGAYRLRFQTAEWILEGVYGEATARPPIGSIVLYSSTSIPAGWLAADGSCQSRTTYATLFVIVGTQYSACDGSTTFGLPDLRARTAFGYDSGSSTGRVTSAGSSINAGAMGANGGLQTRTLTTPNLPAYTPTGTVGVTLGSPTVTAQIKQASVVSGGGTMDVAVASPNNTTTVTNGLVTAGTPPVTGTSFAGDAQGGTSTPVVTMPPAIILQYIIRTQ